MRHVSAPVSAIDEPREVRAKVGCAWGEATAPVGEISLGHGADAVSLSIIG